MNRRAGRRSIRAARPLPAEYVPPDTHLRILDMIRRIPRGHVCTYGRIAALAGLAGRGRLVGCVLAENPLAEGVPWHRVVNASGRISERGGSGPARQRRLLMDEGVEVDARGRIDLRIYMWNPTLSRRSGRSGL